MARQTKILVICEYADGVLHGTLFSGDRSIIVKRRMKRLEHDLLTLFNEYPSFIKKLSGIIVVPERFGGFASSRLLLTTLNLFAWMHDIPLIPMRWQAKLPTPDRLRRLVQARGTTFRSMVLPQYRTPADITVSKMKKKYMLLR